MPTERLFDFRTVDGEINGGAIKTIREVEKKLNCFPPFVGIAVRGSTTRGYSTESSDLDLVLLYDSTQPSCGVNSDGDIWLLMEMASTLFVETSMSDKFRVVTLDQKDINPERACSEPPSFPADIFRVVTGSKIAKYRRFYSWLIGGLPKQQRNEIILELSRELMADDSLGWEKMAERISGVPMSDYKGEMELYDEVLRANGIAGYDEYESKRYRLWDARIRRLLHVGSTQLEEVT